MGVEPAVDPEALRRAREAAGLTQHELARRVGIAGGERVSQWERGVSTPRAVTIRKIARVLRVPASSLMTNPGDLDLRGLRVQAGLTAREVAERTHVSLPTLSRWECGRFARLPRRERLEALAQALHRSVGEVEEAFDRTPRMGRSVRHDTGGSVDH